MNAPRASKDSIHPLARPLARMTGPRSGLVVTIGLAVLVVLGFVLETVLNPGGWSKYPEAYGGYEILPLVAGAGGILLSWLLVWLISRGPDFYEHCARDFKEGEDV